MSSEPLIELKQADIPRGQVASPSALITNVHWLIRPNEFWIVGAVAGAGKTDLLSTAAGLQRPLKGIHRLFGRDTQSMREDELVASRLRVAMVFATGRLFNNLTVAQNVALPLAYHQNLDQPDLADQVSKTLELTGLAQWQDARPAQITRNLHQRIGLARALALNPEVILIDNPLVGIDPRQGRWWRDFLCDLNRGENRNPVTIVVATDDLRPWIDVGQQFALLKNRSFEAIGDRRQVKASSDALLRELLTPVVEP